MSKQSKSNPQFKRKVIFSLALTSLLFISIYSNYSFPIVRAPGPPYHLLIITDSEFNDPCQILANWKISTGMSAVVTAWQGMNLTYPGRDAPERIKRGIEEYHRLAGTRYVLLVGDVDHFPVRYIRLDWNVSTPDKTHSADFVYSASDLYYADLYNPNDEFQTWDSDGNGIYGELWGAHILRGEGHINHDTLDMVPDIAVGRVPASSVIEVQNFVDKVISYEKYAEWTTSPWVRGALLIGTGVPDLGQYALSETFSGQLNSVGFTVTRLYDADPATPPRPYPFRPSHTSIDSELIRGKGYVNFAGHGNPLYCPAFGTTGGDYRVLVANCTAAGFDNKMNWFDWWCPHITGTPMVGNFTWGASDDIIFFQTNGSIYHSRVTLPHHYGFAHAYHYNELASHILLGHPRIGDFTGDGRDDIAIISTTTGEVWVSNFANLLYGFTGYLPTLWHSSFLTAPRVHFVGDFSGDGMADIAHFESLSVQVAVSTGTGFSAKSSWHDTLPTDSSPIIGDYDGDGDDDIAFLYGTSGDIYVALSTGEQFDDPTLWRSAFCPDDIHYGARVKSGDFNGDGMDDLVLFLIDSQIGGSRVVGSDTYYLQGDVMVTRSDGSSFQTPERWHEHFTIGNQIPGVGDFDQDGRDDIIAFARTPPSDPFTYLNNRDKYPIIFAASCSTAQYAHVPPWQYYVDETGTNHTGSHAFEIFPDTLFHGNTYQIPPPPASLQAEDPSCMAERFLVEYGDRGAVAYIGGVEVLQSGPTNELNQYFINHYCIALGTLGNMWNDAIIDYLDAHGFGRGETSLTASDWFDVAQYHHPSKMTLFGDPSLRVLGTGEPQPTNPITTIIIAGGIISGIVTASIFAVVMIRRRRS